MEVFSLRTFLTTVNSRNHQVETPNETTNPPRGSEVNLPSLNAVQRNRSTCGLCKTRGTETDVCHHCHYFTWPVALDIIETSLVALWHVVLRKMICALTRHRHSGHWTSDTGSLRLEDPCALTAHRVNSWRRGRHHSSQVTRIHLREFCSQNRNKLNFEHRRVLTWVLGESRTCLLHGG